MKRAAHLVAVIALAGCAAPQPPARPPSGLPERYPGAAAGAPEAAAAPRAALAPDWWTRYREPALDRLVAQALEAGTDVRLAAARVDEAAVAVGLARAAQWPSVELTAGVTRSRSSTLAGQPVPPGGPQSTAHRVALATAFEIDLWGRLRDATDAAREQLLAAQHARDTVRLSLAATLVQAWLGVRALDRQQATVESQIAIRRDSLALAQRRLDAGIASGLDVAQAEGALAAQSAQAIELRRQRALLVNQIGQLADQPGLTIAADPRPLAAPPPPPPGLPSDLLQRRPDVQQAEAAMRASFAQFEVTRKSAWPMLQLTGSLGSQSAELVDLLKSGARLWSIGPSLLVSLFDAGRNQARSDEARARAEQAAIGWQKAAQTAFREVADALAGSETLAAQETEVQRQRDAAAQAQRLAERRYAAGVSAYLEVLDAQRGAADAELALLRVRQARLDADLALVKALGGGWTAADGERVGQAAK